MLTYFILKSLMQKKATGNIYLGCEASLENDFISIKMHNEVDSYVIKSITKDSIVAASSNKEEINIARSDLKNFNITATHYYKHWKVEYPNIYVAFIKAILPYQKIRWMLLEKRSNAVLLKYNKEAVLAEILKNVNSDLESVSFYVLREKIYGIEANDRSDYAQSAVLRFMLLALEESGDISLDDKIIYVENIKIKPKSLNTISFHEQSSRLHKDALTQSRQIKLLTFALVGVGLLQAYVAYIK